MKKDTCAEFSDISKNPFIAFGQEVDAETESGNGALKYTTTGDAFVDQFTKAAAYIAPRDYDSVSRDMEVLWNIDPDLTMKFLLYLRLISRITVYPDGTKSSVMQRGAGLKSESIMRMAWLSKNHEDCFKSNINLFISAGSWKDVFRMLYWDMSRTVSTDGKVLDSQQCFDWDFLMQIIWTGLVNDDTTNLVRKYLPQIKSRKRIDGSKTDAVYKNYLAKTLARFIFENCDNGEKRRVSEQYMLYRRLKSNGTAHQWQQMISRQLFDKIDFDTIAGRALFQLLGGDFLEKHGLDEKYGEWISSKDVAKFTGFPYELAKRSLKKNIRPYEVNTINKQFESLVQYARTNASSSSRRPIAVVDISGSMDADVVDNEGRSLSRGFSSKDMALSSAIYFNEMMDEKSPFKEHYLVFSYNTMMKKILGNGFVQKFSNARGSCPDWGSTNLQSVIDFFVRFRKKNPLVDESLIPNFVVCFSDGEFNSAYADSNDVVSNVFAARQALSKVYSKEFSESFGFCFVDIRNSYYDSAAKCKFETFGSAKNVFYFGGYDMSPLAFLFGVPGTSSSDQPQTAKEMFLACMNQEIMGQLWLTPVAKSESVTDSDASL